MVDMMECSTAHWWLIVSVTSIFITSGVFALMAYSMLVYTFRFRRVSQQPQKQLHSRTPHAETPLHSPPDRP